jgi:hypothetical protein
MRFVSRFGKLAGVMLTNGVFWIASKWDHDFVRSARYSLAPLRGCF